MGFNKGMFEVISKQKSLRMRMLIRVFKGAQLLPLLLVSETVLKLLKGIG